MKHINKFLFIVIALAAVTGCKKYFDVNADPSSPQDADLAALLPPVLANTVFQNAVDGANAGILSQHYTTNTGNDGHNIHAGNPGGAAGTGFWRVFYVTMGTSLNLIVEKGMQDENWDYVGVAHAIRAWGFQQATDYFGELPFRDAWKSNTATFRYDDQEVIYKGIDSLLRLSLVYLNRTDGKVANSSLSRGDIVYKGDRAKWVKFVYGMLARHYNRYTNKGIYQTDNYDDSVTKFVDLSFASNADNFQVAYPATKNDDTNPFGPARNNFATTKQSRFITQLLDGTILTGSYNSSGVFTPGNPAVAANRDPRLRTMLSISADTTTTSASMPVANGGYRFNVLAQTGGGDFEASATGGGTAGTPAWRRRPSVVYADSMPTNTGNAVFAKAGRFIFQNNAPGTLMAYHELQFIKAEAALRGGNKALAHAAYIKGIDAHFAFVNTYTALAGAPPQMTAAQLTAYKASPSVEQNASSLTLTDVMLQKFIGDWGWNPYETWADIRRYHYFDLDPETGQRVYTTFDIPFYSTTNLGPKPAYRFLPTNFSEFDWNESEIRRLGGFNQDYHTYEMWFSQP